MNIEKGVKLENTLNLRNYSMKSTELRSKKYLENTLELLENIQIGKAFRVLKNLGAQPGESVDSCSFELPHATPRK